MNSVYWKSAFFFKRTIIELQQKGWDKFINEKKIYNNKSINIYDKPLYIIQKYSYQKIDLYSKVLEWLLALDG